MSLYERAAIIPGRSMTCSKAPGRMWPVSVDTEHYAADDGRSYDAYVNSLVDMQCALGARSLSNSPQGGVLSLPTAEEIDAAELMLRYVTPWASHVRFVKTGSEACAGALMVAREYTKRQRVMVAEGSYHGWHGWTKYRGRPNTEGQWTLIYPYGDMTWDVPDDVAAIFVEPARWQTTPSGYMQWLRKQADASGALLVADSMIYGGRFALGGASEYFNFTPDIECFGKAIANGEAAAVFVGREAVAQYGDQISGTYSGDRTGLSAVIDTLKVYIDEPVIETLWHRGRLLQRGLDALVEGRTDVVREGAAVHQRLRFLDKAKSDQFALEMYRRKVLWHQEVVNVMYQHSRGQIAAVLQAAAESLAAIG